MLADEAARRDPQALWQRIEERGIGRIFLPYVALQQLALTARGQRPSELREVFVAGEQLQITPAITRLFEAGGCRLHNHYGPTETHVVTAHSLPEDVHAWPALPPIGRPIANVEIRVLDGDMEEVATGGTGELYVGGPCLARGYFRRPDLTRERFVPNPFGPGRLYQTGDLVRRRFDETIDFLGRLDDQVKIRGFRVELGEVEVTLRQHDLVRHAAVSVVGDSPDDRQLVAQVVPDARVWSTPGRRQTQHVAYWRQVWDATYKASPDHPTNYPGWTDSSTGRPFSAADMREWVDSSVSRILAWRPARVLEIGCGDGQLLLRVAPHCSRYVGTDVSSKALELVDRRLRRTHGPRPNVSLDHRPAHDLRGLPAESFDAIVINSVTELFPSTEYLVGVLEAALERIEPGGFLFVGDVRSLSLQSASYALTQLDRASPELSVRELRRRIARQAERESHLFVDPALFMAFKSRFPRVSHLQCQPRRGWRRNEMTRFRYDATLHVEREQTSQDGGHELDWLGAGLTLPDVREYLKERRPEALTVRNIPNARLVGPVRLLELLERDERESSVGELRRVLASTDDGGVEPESLWRLGRSSEHDGGHTAYIGASISGAVDLLDVTYRRRSSVEHVFDVPVSHASDDDEPRSLSEYGNDPLRGQKLRDFESELRGFLTARLPEYMVPSRFFARSALPLTSTAKVDRRALSAPIPARPDIATPLVDPRTEMEERIAAAWRAVLQLDSVGIHDNFFDLGGDSIRLAHVYERLESVVGQVPFIALFEHPTVHALAEHLRGSGDGDRPRVDHGHRGKRTRQGALIRAKRSGRR